MSSEMLSGSGRPLRVLLVGSDMHSHILAGAKLARWLVEAGHDVTFAVPGEASVPMAAREVRGSMVNVVQVGRTAVVMQANVHGAEDYSSWQAMFNAMQMPFMRKVELMQEQMAPVYLPLLELIGKVQPDVLVHNHSTYSPAGDAAEKAGIPVVCFVHLPYDPCFFMGYEATTKYPKMIPFFPHVASYSATAEPSLSRRCWQWLDAFCAKQSWAGTSQRMQRLREARGLRPAPADFASYLMRHPCVVLGGPPFGPPAPVPPLATIVGDVEKEPGALPKGLREWVEGSGPEGIVFISMGTGQTLSADEARQIARGLGRQLGAGGSQKAAGPRLLWALRQRQQEELQQVLREELGEPERLEACGGQGCDDSDRPPLEFLGGAVRVEQFPPQYALLGSGRVRLFITHMGFGAFTETVRCGVPVLAHPGGWDQEYNTARAIDAGLGVRAPKGFVGIEAAVRRCLADGVMKDAAVRAQRQLRASCAGGPLAVRAIERFARMSRQDAARLRPTLEACPDALREEVRCGSDCEAMPKSKAHVDRAIVVFTCTILGIVSLSAAWLAAMSPRYY